MSSASPSATGLREAKRSLRARVLKARDALSPAERASASQAIAATLSQRPDFDSARVVLLTLPFGSEWDTRLLLAAALARGKTVAAPRVNVARRMLELHELRDAGLDVCPGYRGIPEPRGECPKIALAAIDWILVPGVAFDAQGRRVGYGGGYYDRLLPTLPASAQRVAGAFELPHDLALDTIVTEARVIVPAPR
jgi:5-formyltetrahydrofolate cyclo-ligase